MKKNINLYLMLLFILCSCSSESSSNGSVTEETVDVGVLATLKTNEAEDITARLATIWGRVENNGGSTIVERGVCYGIGENPTYESNKEKASVTKGSGEFKVELANLEGSTVYYARAYVVNKKGVAYGNQISFKTLEPASPLIVLGEIKVAGAYDLFLDVVLKEHGDLDIQEIGLVYNTAAMPTVEDTKIANSTVEENYKQRISDLTPETTYHVRPYALTPTTVLYGEEIEINTITKGNFTYTFNQNDADKATIARIKAAFDSATMYYNNFTSIVKHVTVNYSPGTPTADANFAGWINMGAKESYQRTGTAMHEMAHTVGVGTSSKYRELMIDVVKGEWQGKRANEILQMMTDNPSAHINGDAMHFWPYGINGSWEDKDDEFIYIMNALILQGMKSDGMPSN